MTDEQRANAIRAYIAGIERIKKTHPNGPAEYDRATDRVSRRLQAIAKLCTELQKNGRSDLWEEFTDWARALSKE
jgi:hypothetical protein